MVVVDQRESVLFATITNNAMGARKTTAVLREDSEAARCLFFFDGGHGNPRWVRSRRSWTRSAVVVEFTAQFCGPLFESLLGLFFCIEKPKVFTLAIVGYLDLPLASDLVPYRTVEFAIP